MKKSTIKKNVIDQQSIMETKELIYGTWQFLCRVLFNKPETIILPANHRWSQDRSLRKIKKACVGTSLGKSLWKRINHGCKSVIIRSRVKNQSENRHPFGDQGFNPLNERIVMFDLPKESDLLSLPDLSTNEHVPAPDRIVQLHLFSYQTDWYFCEYNPYMKNLYGMVVVKNDFDNATWAYFTLSELEDIAARTMDINWDRDFTISAVRDIEPLRVDFSIKTKIYT